MWTGSFNRGANVGRRWITAGYGNHTTNLRAATPGPIPARRLFSATAPLNPASLPPGLAKFLGNAILVIGCGIATYYYFPQQQKPPYMGIPEEEHVVTNWSATHEAKTKVYIQPETLEELQTAVSLAHAHKQKLRPVGSGLSPNGIGLSDHGMINLALMDKILSIDTETKQVTVQAGARVEQVVEGLRPHGLTLQNFASIKEQQIGGFIQVSAHGTGATLPPADEQVVSLKLVTPAKGTLDLSVENNPEIFYLARCSLGTLGVIAEVTLQCVPVQKLLEYTFVTNKKEVRKRHKKWLQENKYLRYMWIPDTDAVVVIQCNPLPEDKAPRVNRPRFSYEEQLEPVRLFYKEVVSRSNTGVVLSDEEIAQLSFTELRDKLLELNPLDREHVIQVNKVEAEYWKRCQGHRVGWSDEILGFDCGGQQWVSEVCFPTGTLKKNDESDLNYMDKLLDLIKEQHIPAPAPIEQRWTASSTSPMSPAYSISKDNIFSWVGIIMYLPSNDDAQRAAITDHFMEYRSQCQGQLWDTFSAFEHWSKIEVTEDDETMLWMQERLRKCFPVEALNKARRELDPNNILANDIIDKLFPLEQDVNI